MGIWDFINSSTEAVKRNAPDFAPVKNACRTSFSYGSAACTKIDNTVRVNGLRRLNQWLPDDEAKSKIGIFAVKFAKNAGLYALHEGYKLVPVPGVVAVSNIVSKTIKEVKSETLNEKPRPLGDGDSAPEKQFTGTRKLMDREEIQPGSFVDSIGNQTPEDVIRIFMMKEFVGSHFLDDLMVPKPRKGKKQPE